MFYVKGNSHLLSFSNPLANQQKEEEEGHKLLTERQTDTSSFIIHHLLGCVDMLPAFLVIASSMSLLTYLYTILLIPTVMTATLSMLNNQTQNGTIATNIPVDIGCPFLLPRSTPALDVHDLRPDDISIVIGLGDSVMAGFAAKGIQDSSFFTLANLYENRGISFAMGGVKYFLLHFEIIY